MARRLLGPLLLGGLFAAATASAAPAAEVMRCSSTGLQPPVPATSLSCIFPGSNEGRRTSLADLYADGWKVRAMAREPERGQPPRPVWWMYLDRD